VKFVGRPFDHVVVEDGVRLVLVGDDHRLRRNSRSRGRLVRRGVSKGVEDGRRPPILQADHPQNDRKAVSGVAHLHGEEGSGWAGPGETLGIPWIPLGPCHTGLVNGDALNGESERQKT
jgi:hypothetical protein